MIGQLVAFLGVSAVVICVPGPDTALTVRNALAGGRRCGVATAAGVAPSGTTTDIQTAIEAIGDRDTGRAIQTAVLLEEVIEVVALIEDVVLDPTLRALDRLSLVGLVPESDRLEVKREHRTKHPLVHVLRAPEPSDPDLVGGDLRDAWIARNRCGVYVEIGHDP